MFIPLVVAPLHDFASMRFIFLFRSIGQKAHVIVYIEVEERARLSTGLVDDKIIKGVVL